MTDGEGGVMIIGGVIGLFGGLITIGEGGVMNGVFGRTEVGAGMRFWIVGGVPTTTAAGVGGVVGLISRGIRKAGMGVGAVVLMLMFVP